MYLSKPRNTLAYRVLASFLLFIPLIVSAQDSSGVTRIGSLYHNWLDCDRVVVSGNYAYAVTSNGLSILNISNPAAPQQVSFLENGSIDSSDFDVAVSGNYAYVAGYHGMRVINVSNPVSPQAVGSYQIPVYAHTVAISGNYAYIAAEDSSVLIINISNPASPEEVSVCRLPGYTFCATVSGNYMYSSSASKGWITDISNPADPQLVDSISIGQYFSAVAVSGNYAFFQGYDSLYIYNVSNPTNVQYVSRILTHGYNSVRIAGNYAYVSNTPSAGYGTRLLIIDISNPASPSVVGNYQSRLWESDAAVVGNYAYLFCDYGLRVLNISAPTAPVSVGYFTTGKVAQVAISPANYAYVADMFAGIRIVNVATPSNPQEVGSVATPGYANHIEISGNYAYVADGDSGLRVFNITNPTNPTFVSVYPTPAPALETNVSGSYAYVADADSGLLIINISNPASPQLIGRVNNIGYADRVEVCGNFAYVLASDGIHTINISDPSAPIQIGTITTWGYISGFHVTSNYLFLGDNNYETGSGNLLIYDITSSGSSQPVGIISMHLAVDVQLIGNYALVVSSGYGLRILNVTDHSNPQEVGFYNTPGWGQGLQIVGNHAYVADWTNFGIYDISQALGVVEHVGSELPRQFSLKQNFPNPFNPTTTIEYTIPKTSNVSMKLFDVTGREVGALVNFSQNPGTYRVRLDANKLASGIYFYRLTASGFSATKKLSVVK